MDRLSAIDRHHAARENRLNGRADQGQLLLAQAVEKSLAQRFEALELFHTELG